MASYSTIIATLDAAIADWADQPITRTIEGRSMTYRSLDELLRARKYYAQLAASAANSKPFKISYLKSGGPR